MTSLPDIDQVRSLPAHFEMTVPDDYIDENGHMNITKYFELGAWAPWQRISELGAGEDYITERALSFFTVEHHIRYLGELRLGEPLSVRPALVARTGKALHAIAFVIDESRDKIACTMEVLYVHVSMETRRSVEIPDDVAAGLDGEIAERTWALGAATGLTLRR
ncbi:thioesterase family protein [Nocardioides sp.]|uniref:acyl-CoA thioesterase n=1 Tax=Nocardioides sp. TaxID=35761 RepID=UPI002718467D|nr:thioesterase family protein [Nocardioides sp.]MDO9456438.1 thioesterase family protein [Nocardioides sp.]